MDAIPLTYLQTRAATQLLALHVWGDGMNQGEGLNLVRNVHDFGAFFVKVG
jgi:hypothetical protein